MKPLYTLFVLFLFSAPVAYAQQSKLRVEKMPEWVTANAIDYTNSKLDHEAEDGYLNLAFEKQVSLPAQSTYIRKVIKILSEAGVQNSSEISVNFDPSYSKLAFHTIKIIRGAASIDKLELSKIKVIQQETELSRHLYNGALSAILFLEDVRKGDVIEYSYTLKGFNPIFKGKYSELFQTSFSVPVCNLYYKINIAKTQTLQIKNSLTDVSCSTKQSDKEIMYEWRLNDIPALHIEDNTPSWYDPYAMIMVTEFQTWKEVNDWAMDLFPTAVRISPVLQKQINEIKSASTDPEKRILAALRLVQDEVRYMGIEMGVNSHKPSHPDKIFGQRFGDCKDKSYLLTTMLRSMDIEADPVLINTTYKKTIESWLPSPIVFDHVTVRVKLNDKYYWFDPTISYQRGGIENISYPNYQCGLVVSEKNTWLTTIPTHDRGMVRVKEVFEIPNTYDAAQLIVKTEYTGAYADNTRSDFHNNSRYEIQKQFQEYYGGYFDKIKSDSINYTDDETSGTFTTTEYYTITDLWKLEKRIKKASFSPFVISGLLNKPKDVKRTMPFRLAYPVNYKEEIEINLPEEWDAEASTHSFSSAGFYLSAKYSSSYKQILLEYEYETLKDHISPDETEQYLVAYKKADDHIGYNLSKKEGYEFKASENSEATAIGGFIGFSILIGIGVIVWWTIRKARSSSM